MRLKAKFNLVMLMAFVPGLGLAAALSYPFTQYSARNEVIAEAALMARQAAAISDYTDREVNPLLAGQLKTRFLPQTIPFSVTQAVFRILQTRYPEYSYRNPATNPTNPADRPADWQADIIDAFRRKPELQRLVTERDTPTGRVLTVSQPIRVDDKGCLQCHSTPAIAPASLVDLYGSQNGFGWHLGDIVGAQVITVPMRLPLEQAWRNFELFMAGLAALFMLMLLISNLLLHFVVIRPVHRVSQMAHEVSLGNFDVPECETRGRDEIASLAESFNRMRRSLVAAMRLLRE